MIELNQEYLEEIKCRLDKSKSWIDLNNGGVCETNEFIKNQVIKDLTEISFTSLYTTLMLEFQKCGFINCISEEDIEKIEYFFEIRRSLREAHLKPWPEYINLRTEINKMFGKYHDKDFLTFKLRNYMLQVFDEFKKLNPNSWIYIDTDCIFLQGDVKVPDNINLPYDIDVHDYGLFIRNKNYTIVKDSEFKDKGFSSRRIKERDDIRNRIIKYMRDDKLNELNIEDGE